VRYRIEFADEAVEELEALRPYDAERILDAIEAFLRHEPMRISRQRKPVSPVGLPPEVGITWELRVGHYRGFYDVEDDGVIVIRIVRKGRRTTEESLT
jgi:mRNA-degrading endonuclease RelE of RelBE toxin-antitoxin system